VPSGSKEVTIVTTRKEDENWSRALTLPNLEELTLHDPTHEQLGAIGELHSLKRLRITHARPRSIGFIESMRGVEELVLEYVSGFSDLSPLRRLKRLRALHIENLRRVSNFSGLSGIDSLRYLAINGTLDWKQPIESLSF
jgi:Leucine-rich repeat (LRR) protein